MSLLPNCFSPCSSCWSSILHSSKVHSHDSRSYNLPTSCHHEFRCTYHWHVIAWGCLTTSVQCQTLLTMQGIKCRTVVLGFRTLTGLTFASWILHLTSINWDKIYFLYLAGVITALSISLGPFDHFWDTNRIECHPCRCFSNINKLQ